MNIILNFAISADGKIGTKQKDASKFTSQKDLERLWAIRMRADALMVGRGTLEADHMSMTIPEHCHPDRQPLRLIISRQGQFDLSHKVFHTPHGGAIHLLGTEQAPSAELEGVTTHHQSLASFLTHCEQQLGIQTLLCEGGGELVRSLAELGVISEINLTIAGHTLIGGAEAPGILGNVMSHLPASQHFQITHFEPLETGECFLTYQRVD